jgi:glycerol-3-phosphate dehydrogenase
MRAAWTANAHLPGGDLSGVGFAQYAAIHFRRDSPWLPDLLRRSLARRHGANACRVLDDAKALSDLRMYFGAGLYAREVDYMIENELALSGEAILYRCTKAGLHLAPAQQEALANYMVQRAATH